MLEDPRRKARGVQGRRAGIRRLPLRERAAADRLYVYLDEEGSRATVVQVHPDSESIELHMKVARPHFARFMEFYEPGGTIEVHGTPAAHVSEQMQRMAQRLGVTIVVKELSAGFVRSDVR